MHKQGVVTAADIADDTVYQVVNPDQIICTLDQDTMFECEFQVRVGRGFATGDENKVPDMPIGVIPIDSIFSPVTRVKYSVQNTRVGQMTDYDKLILEVWTDGRIAPADAMLQASAICAITWTYSSTMTTSRSTLRKLLPPSRTRKRPVCASCST